MTKSKILNYMTVFSVGYSDIEKAAERLKGVVNHTPLATSSTLNRALGASIFLKPENLQRTGAFKFRGAYNALHQLRESGITEVLTYSSGNHAQAVALAASLLGLRSKIIMPTNAPTVKLQATAGYGGKIITYDPREISREELAQKIALDEDLPILPPYDHPFVIAGQGTAALELFSDAPDLDYLFVCCGGGGLLSGSAICANAMSPNTRVIGVEPELADDAARSFATGTLQTTENPPTIADGARTPYLGKHTFPIVLNLVHEFVTVSEAQIAEAMQFFFERTKMVVEPTGALALAGAFKKKVPPGASVGIIVSGGNVDLQRISEYLALV